MNLPKSLESTPEIYLPDRIEITPEIITESEELLNDPINPRTCHCPVAIAIGQHVPDKCLIATAPGSTLIGSTTTVDTDKVFGQMSKALNYHHKSARRHKPLRRKWNKTLFQYRHTSDLAEIIRKFDKGQGMKPIALNVNNLSRKISIAK